MFYLLAIFSGFSFLLNFKTKFDIIEIILSAHFTTYCSLTLLIICCLIKETRNIHIKDQIIIRIGIIKFFTYQYLTLLIMSLFYLFTQYSLAFLLGTIKDGEFRKTAILGLALNAVLIIINTLIINLVNLKIKPILIFIISIIIILIFHYEFWMEILAKNYYG
jgi:hypothetical protein